MYLYTCEHCAPEGLSVEEYATDPLAQVCFVCGEEAQRWYTSAERVLKALLQERLRQRGACTCKEVDAGGCVGFDRTGCPLHDPARVSCTDCGGTADSSGTIRHKAGCSIESLRSADTNQRDANRCPREGCTEPPPMMTLGELRTALADVPDSAWVCLRDGPVAHLRKELGANEPFILLEVSANQRDAREHSEVRVELSAACVELCERARAAHRQGYSSLALTEDEFDRISGGLRATERWIDPKDERVHLLTHPIFGTKVYRGSQHG